MLLEHFKLSIQSFGKPDARFVSQSPAHRPGDCLDTRLADLRIDHDEQRLEKARATPKEEYVPSDLAPQGKKR